MVQLRMTVGKTTVQSLENSKPGGASLRKVTAMTLLTQREFPVTRLVRSVMELPVQNVQYVMVKGECLL